ncbi:MAG: adenylyltransferase/cytidyltransferase family protein [Clostridia bacterium]|nr:adenylyltransferase/cytidyltransferase family protein [Clostridia bacterium]
MKKPFELGFAVGRFQTFHNGHKDMIDKALAVCSRFAVFIGSSQECGTEKNPFSYEIRAEFFRRIYGEKISVFPLPDIGAGNNCAWGEYVLDTAIERLGSMPDLFVTGKEERRAEWLSGEKGKNVTELVVPKTVDVSAARMRELFICDDHETWKSYSDKRLWELYPVLRRIVLGCRGVTDTSSI